MFCRSLRLDLEVVTTGNTTQAAPRLTDEEWHTQLQQGNYLPVPTWTSTFRLTAQQRQTLVLPTSFPADWKPQGPFSPLSTPSQ